MLIVKNILRIPAVCLVIIGFLAGSFLSGAQSSCCCETIDNCCCCITDEVEPVNTQPTSIKDICGCEMTESEPPEYSSLEAQTYTKSPNNTEKTEPLPLCRESLVSFDSITPLKTESTRNSGPPIFISISSLLI